MCYIYKNTLYKSTILYIIINIKNDFILFLQPAVHATEPQSSETILQGLGCDNWDVFGFGFFLVSFDTW